MFLNALLFIFHIYNNLRSWNLKNENLAITFSCNLSFFNITNVESWTSLIEQMF